jgi:hypothetical protein
VRCGGFYFAALIAVMVMKNLTGVAAPGLFPDSGLAAQNQQQLSEEEKLRRKRALFSGASGQSNPYGWMWPGQMSALGTPMV